ncbi:hypothetical protein [Sphingomonas sp.]|uniref:hypothetical protein n=1 Tax=Sphingomonas sp. TaxID=28214 RepID=UPI002DD62E84|nr:hypothetical protein [Sphingomonas sp.]
MKVRRYLTRTGMAPTVFGRSAVNDPRLVSDLLRGRQPRASMTARIDAFMTANPVGRS